MICRVELNCCRASQATAVEVERELRVSESRLKLQKYRRIRDSAFGY